MIESKELKGASNEKDDLDDQKQKSLDKIDNAKFSCFHVRAIVVSGIGFFTVSAFEKNFIPNLIIRWKKFSYMYIIKDSYDLFVM
jgi:hypothetical protein